jgi:predicted ATPase
VIAERIGRLADPLQEALRAASVEGETFTAEVVARVQASHEREMVARLSDELDRRHRLVRAQGMVRIRDQLLSQYSFRHILFQKYLYDHLDPVLRARLHREVGTALEVLYGEGAEEISVQLARHFQKAGMAKNAIPYLHQAGDRAVRLSANEEAITHFTQGLELLETLPDTPERAQQELALQLSLGAPLEATKGYAAPEVGRAYARAHELCQQIGETPRLLPALGLLWSFNFTRAEHQKARELAAHFLSLAQRLEDPLQVALAHRAQGFTLLHMGEPAPALTRLEHMIDFYDLQQHRSLAFLYAQDVGVSSLSYAVWALWLLGYPNQAAKYSQDALALAQELDHPHTLAFALTVAGATFHIFRREVQAFQEATETGFRLAREEGFAFWQAAGTLFQGWVHTKHGQFDEGIAQMRQGLATWEAMSTGIYRPFLLALLAEAYGKAGRVEEGLKTLSKALDVVEKTGERYYEAELHRIQGELLRMKGDEIQAEASFHQAIEVARRQQAKSWELRAAMSLSRLWQKQGKREEARELLSEIYNWFTEGFDTADLKEAKALLEELS